MSKMKHQGGAKGNKGAGAVGAPDEEKPQEENGPCAPRPKRVPKPNPKYFGPEWAQP